MVTDSTGDGSRRISSIWVGGIVAFLVVAAAVLVVLALVLPGLDPASDAPVGDWPTSTPQEQDMDPAKFEEMLAYIDNRGIEVDSIIVVRNGHIVLEEYGPGYFADTKHSLYSVNKSVTSMLVGTAVRAGLIEDLDTPVTELLPDYTPDNLDERKERLTLRHLLTMSDGIDWDEGRYDYEDPRNPVNQMVTSSDVVQFVLDRPMAHEPGEVWNYNSGATILLGGILEAATGRDLLAYAREALFDPLGIGPIYWAPAPGDHYHTHGGMKMTPRDMARLGYLMLQQGKWDGQEILTQDWVTDSTTAHQQTGGPNSYGYQWWIMPGGQGYLAAGLYDQAIYVLPEADMVVVATASIPGGSLYSMNGLLNTFILPACTDLKAEPVLEVYDTHGFRLEYPAGFFLHEEPIPGAKAITDASGLVQLTSNWEPLEIVLVLWHKASGGEDPVELLDGFFEGLATTGVKVERGEFGKSDKDGEPVALQYSRLTIEEGTLPAISGVWHCHEDGRALVVTYATVVEATPEELLAAYEEYVAGFSCQ